ncbi:MAG: hypothetical protein ACKOPQ_10045 [Novosphingobium sp.]|jgi:hypothetical protein
MATTKPKSPVALRAPRRRWPWLLLLAALGVLMWYWTPLIGLARTGASVGARVACSCRFVAGRSLGDCRKDFEPGMGLIMLSEDVAAKSVTARFPLLASQTATFRDGPGCVLEPWDD